MPYRASSSWSSSPPSSSSSRAGRGFTLIELLVVIGIIAILVSVLLPVLASSRRAGMKVKCAASLHQIGDAFKMYAIDNKGWWPIVKWAVPSGSVPAGSPNVMSWHDFLFPYLHKGTTLPLANIAGNTGTGSPDQTGTVEFRSDLAALRGSSALWGCPAFRAELYYNASNDIERYSTGYGMNYHPHAPYPAWDWGLAAATQVDLCIYEKGTGSGYLGRFYKHTEWLRQGSERGVLADSNQFWIWTNTRKPNKSTFSCEPFFDGSAGSTFIRVDGSRHLNTTNKQKILQGQGINMLFADGHVGAVSPYEAYNATLGGGKDILGP